MKKILLIVMFSLFVFACTKTETKEITKNTKTDSGKSTVKETKVDKAKKSESKKTEKHKDNKEKNKSKENLIKNIEGIYKSLDNCTGFQNIRIRKIEKTDSYTVEFGSFNKNEFISAEDYYSYFSTKKYPNIEFSCETGRIREAFQDSNTLEVYKFKIEEEDKTLVLKGIIYQANMSEHPPILIPHRDKEQNLFIKIKELEEEPALQFFTVKPEDAPIHVYISEFNKNGVTCNSKELKFKQKYKLEELENDIGPYIDYEELAGNLIVIYPNLELHFNYGNEFLGIGKKFTTIEKLNIFDFEFSYKTTAEELKQFAEKNSYKLTKESASFNFEYYNIFLNNGLKIFAIFNLNNNSIEKILVVPEEN